MESIIAEKCRLDYGPVGIMWSDTKPDDSLQLKKGANLCIMYLFAQVVTNRRTAAFDRTTSGCPGAVAGLGFGTGYPDAFGGAGIEFMSCFFSKGEKSSNNPKKYSAVVNHVPEREREKFLAGERFHESPEKAARWMEHDLPKTDVREHYVLFAPLEGVHSPEKPVVVVFVADALQLSGLVTLAGAVIEGIDPVIVPPGAACQQIGTYAYEQGRSDKPRAVLGYTDLSARYSIGHIIDNRYLTLAVPYSLYSRMEKEAVDGVFDGPLWRKLMEKKVKKQLC
ncbi:MAG TPA: DUF169 domain-containing protein [Methanoregulaceae archaeon]|nr:DUF169 domain-containing protein [Methanoregulaceae archaeon]